VRVLRCRVRRARARPRRGWWLVDTAADVVLVFRRSAASGPTFDVALELTTDDTLTTPLVPGWEIDLAHLFAR